MDDIKIGFYPLGIIGSSCLAFLSLIIGPIVIFILCLHGYEHGKILAIYFFFGFLIFDILILSQSFVFFRGFLAFVQKKPAILLTKDYYIDNIENVKVSWKDISNISILTDIGSFLKITVVDNSKIYGQTKNLISKFRFWNTAWSGGILSVNMSLLQGKNLETVKTIEEYHQKVKNLKNV